MNDIRAGSIIKLAKVGVLLGTLFSTLLFLVVAGLVIYLVLRVAG